MQHYTVAEMMFFPAEESCMQTISPHFLLRGFRTILVEYRSSLMRLAETCHGASHLVIDCTGEKPDMLRPGFVGMHGRWSHDSGMGGHAYTRPPAFEGLFLVRTHKWWP